MNPLSEIFKLISTITVLGWAYIQDSCSPSSLRTWLFRTVLHRQEMESLRGRIRRSHIIRNPHHTWDPFLLSTEHENRINGYYGHQHRPPATNPGLLSNNSANGTAFRVEWMK